MNNNVIPSNSPIVPNRFPLEYILYICLAVTVVGCFLPFATIEALGVSSTTNFVYKEELLQGIYVVGLAIGAFIAVFKNKKYIVSLGMLIGAFLLTMSNYMDVKNAFEENLVKYPSLKGFASYSYGIGFYIIVLSLLVAIVLSAILYMKNKKSEPIQPIPQPMINNQMYMNNVMNNQFQAQQPVKCHYCGSTKNSGDYCKNCGGKY
jgi:hypothetical protein